MTSREPKIRRQLPHPGRRNHGLRRAQSLSFLPRAQDDDAENRPRRKLPETGQGRLIKLVSEKLKEESVLRLQVAKELKEEKRLRWEAEDEAERLRKEVSQLKTIVAEKSTQLSVVSSDFDHQQKQYDALSQKHVTLQEQFGAVEERLHKAEARDSEHAERERLLEQAWGDLYAQQRENQRLKDNYELLIATIDRVQPGASKALLETMKAAAMTVASVDV